MLTAVVARPPVVGGTVKSADTAAALAVPGVMKVVEIPGSGLGAKFKPLGGLAVVARNTWAAIQGRDALTIEWEAGPRSEERRVGSVCGSKCSSGWAPYHYKKK